MRIRWHHGFAHGIGKHNPEFPVTDSDMNCPSCRAEKQAGITPVITGEDQ